MGVVWRRCGRVFKHEKIMVLLCNSLSASANAAMTRFLEALLPYHWLTDESLDDLNIVIAWSFDALLESVWPSQRHDGRPLNPEDGAFRNSKQNELLADGFCGAFLRSGRRTVTINVATHAERKRPGARSVLRTSALRQGGAQP